MACISVHNNGIKLRWFFSIQVCSSIESSLGRLEKWGFSKGKKMHAPFLPVLAFFTAWVQRRWGHHSRDRTWMLLAKALLPWNIGKISTIKSLLLYNEKAMDEKGGNKVKKMAAISSLLLLFAVAAFRDVARWCCWVKNRLARSLWVWHFRTKRRENNTFVRSLASQAPNCCTKHQHQKKHSSLTMGLFVILGKEMMMLMRMFNTRSSEEAKAEVANRKSPSSKEPLELPLLQRKWAGTTTKEEDLRFLCQLFLDPPIIIVLLLCEKSLHTNANFIFKLSCSTANGNVISS